MDQLFPLCHLASAAVRGNVRAEEAFANEAWRWALRIAEDRLRGNRLRRHVDPEDIAQMVVIAACTRILRDTKREPIRNWNAMLRLLTDHAIADQARAYRQEMRRRIPMHVECCESDENAIARESRCEPSRWERVEQQIQEIESRLPPQFQKVWCSRREGVRWSEIGAKCGCNGHALRVRFNAWLQRLRAAKDE